MPSEQRTLRRLAGAGAVAAGIIFGALAATGRRAAAEGFVCGAFLSLLSFSGLALLVPWLIRPGASRRRELMLGLTLFIKLPIYGVLLWYISRMSFAGVVAAAAGICTMPVIITVQTLWNATHENQKASRNVGTGGEASKTPVSVLHDERTIHPDTRL